MITIIDAPQLSDEWFAARIGSIGGSSISAVVAKGKGKMRKNLLYRLAGEILSGQKYEGYSNDHMERGIQQEADARDMYEFVSGNHVYQTGLIKASEHKHESPDGLVGDDGKIEIKCTIPSVHIGTIISDKVPSEYVKQIQWGLHICKRKWCDFVSYSPTVISKPIWIKRVERDEDLIAELNDGADQFIRELREIVRKIKPDAF